MRCTRVVAAAFVHRSDAVVLTRGIVFRADGVALLEGTVAGNGAAAAHHLGGVADHAAHQSRQPPPLALIKANRMKNCLTHSGAAGRTVTR